MSVNKKTQFKSEYLNNVTKYRTPKAENRHYKFLLQKLSPIEFGNERARLLNRVGDGYWTYLNQASGGRNATIAKQRESRETANLGSTRSPNNHKKKGATASKQQPQGRKLSFGRRANRKKMP